VQRPGSFRVHAEIIAGEAGLLPEGWIRNDAPACIRASPVLHYG
jgi:hypothetical protein